MAELTKENVESMQVHNETWAGQIRDAMNVNGGDIENATTQDYVLHFLTFGWKILFALVPPPGILGGWLSFFVSLAVIGVLTAVVGDLAAIFGCLVGLHDAVTAITFVALGTSLPDMFASRAAARAEKHADNAIGNITGSNSVNVFLGLGLPWLIASIYHTAKVNHRLIIFHQIISSDQIPLTDSFDRWQHCTLRKLPFLVCFTCRENRS